MITKRARRLAAVLVLLWSIMPMAGLAGPIVKITKSGKVYASPSTDSRSLGTLPYGTVVYQLAQSGKWAKITLDGKTGYIPQSSITNTSVKVFVVTNTLPIYVSPSSSSRLLAAMSYGESMEMTQVEGSWAEVRRSGVTGYCKVAGVSIANPNDVSISAYVQEDGVRVYASASTSSSVLATCKANAKVTVVAYTPDGTWCRLKNGSTYGYVLMKYLKTSKVASASGLSTSTHSVAVDWFTSDITSVLYRGRNAVVTDVLSGISWNIRRTGGIYHADAEPLTALDTLAMQRACGRDYNTWSRRPIWITVAGKKYAASMNCMPHGETDHISGNDFAGCFCIHFTNSKTHCSSAICPQHQACISYALAAG